MTRSEQKVLQYLKEARASELALVRVLQSQIAMTPRGAFRSGLEQHLTDTRAHARRLRERIGELEPGFHPVRLAVGVAEGVVGQALALSKTPLDLVRGGSGEEKVLKNAKDAAATEALEIATYTALERLARRTGDQRTAVLAVGIRREEERMLERVLAAIPGLTDAVHAAEVDGDSSYDVAETGAADAVRRAAGTAKDAVSDARVAAKDGAKAATERVERAARKTEGTASDAGDAAKAAKDRAEKTAAKADQAAKDAARAAADRADDVAAKVEEVVSDAGAVAAGPAVPAADLEKPWPGYDELSVEEIRAVLLTADADAAQEVVDYEAANQARDEVLADAGRKVPSA
ncbi:DUF892 family protein [Patulibacter sp. NPDC049589]|uniref:DUF892 family protein n=1 Tax=Patulibacter sp. NPDC049589 TaxID=3154731 RepID=UPI00343C606C